MVYATCIATAATAYDVPVPGIVANIRTHPDTGIGVMGIPAQWLPILRQIGFAPGRIQSDACTNIAAGAWIMAFEHEIDKQAWPYIDQSKPNPDGIPTDAGNIPSGKQYTTSAADANGVSPSCISAAASRYHLPLALFEGVLKTEGGRVGQTHLNDNGTLDMGPAQINTTWLPKLAESDITEEMVINDGCLNINIGAWILSQVMVGADINKPAQFWQHVGDYNSNTPFWNAKYAISVWNKIVGQK